MADLLNSGRERAAKRELNEYERERERDWMMPTDGMQWKYPRSNVNSRTRERMKERCQIYFS